MHDTKDRNENTEHNQLFYRRTKTSVCLHHSLFSLLPDYPLPKYENMYKMPASLLPSPDPPLSLSHTQSPPPLSLSHTQSHTGTRTCKLNTHTRASACCFTESLYSVTRDKNSAYSVECETTDDFASLQIFTEHSSTQHLLLDDKAKQKLV